MHCKPVVFCRNTCSSPVLFLIGATNLTLNDVGVRSSPMDLILVHSWCFERAKLAAPFVITFYQWLCKSSGFYVSLYCALLNAVQGCNS